MMKWKVKRQYKEIEFGYLEAVEFKGDVVEFVYRGFGYRVKRSLFDYIIGE